MRYYIALGRIATEGCTSLMVEEYVKVIDSGTQRTAVWAEEYIEQWYWECNKSTRTTHSGAGTDPHRGIAEHSLGEGDLAKYSPYLISTAYYNSSQTPNLNHNTTPSTGPPGQKEPYHQTTSVNKC